jgi:hypothetical protein
VSLDCGTTKEELQTAKELAELRHKSEIVDLSRYTPSADQLSKIAAQILHPTILGVKIDLRPRRAPR